MKLSQVGEWIARLALPHSTAVCCQSKGEEPTGYGRLTFGCWQHKHTGHCCSAIRLCSSGWRAADSAG
jgi:hypothetical protein